jgi:hypothetical protein
VADFYTRICCGLAGIGGYQVVPCNMDCIATAVLLYLHCTAFLDNTFGTSCALPQVFEKLSLPPLCLSAGEDVPKGRDAVGWRLAVYCTACHDTPQLQPCPTTLQPLTHVFNVLYNVPQVKLCPRGVMQWAGAWPCTALHSMTHVLNCFAFLHMFHGLFFFCCR